MITAIVGNDEISINEVLQKGRIVVDAEVTQPEEVWQVDLFATDKILINYTKWSPKQRKVFVALENQNLKIFVKVSSLGKKDPLAQSEQKLFILPRNRGEWVEWTVKRAKIQNLEISREQINFMLENTGENAWAIETELQRWSLIAPQIPQFIFRTSEKTIWEWVEAMLQKNSKKANLVLNSFYDEMPVFLMTASLGKRLFSQVVFFSGYNAPKGVASYTWQLTKQSGKYGWNLENSTFWLKSLVEFESKIKGESKLQAEIQFAKWQTEFLNTKS